MKNSEMPAFPISEETTDRILVGVEIFTGLSKREYFAGLAMQAYITSFGKYGVKARETAQGAVEYADALLAELEKPTATPA